MPLHGTTPGFFRDRPMLSYCRTNAGFRRLYRHSSTCNRPDTRNLNSNVDEHIRQNLFSMGLRAAEIAAQAGGEG